VITFGVLALGKEFKNNMAKRLVQVAKELNVGTTTIVEHLNAKGFEVDNSPRTKLTDEMYDILNKEFQGSQAIKEKANKITLGTPKAEKEAKPVTPPKKEVVKRDAPQLTGLKVQGKIELNKPESKTAKPVEKKVEEAPKPKVEETPVKEVAKPAAKETKVEASK